MRPNRTFSVLLAAGRSILVGCCLVGLIAQGAAQNQSASISSATRSGSTSGNPTANGSGGAAQADFDSLIDLIQSTVAYDSWQENGTGEGEISPFATGVYADAQGTLRFSNNTQPRADLRRAPAFRTHADAGDARRRSPLRYVSLVRLERTIRQLQEQNAPLSPEILTLAGLQRIEFVIANSDTHDLILAGPAGDWRPQTPGMLVSSDTGQPVQRLDDLLTLWRLQAPQVKPFGCSIVPRQEALAETQEYLQASAAVPLEPGQTKQWLADLRDALGKQDVEFYSLAPDNHVAQVLLLADYHMKLVGMGLAAGVPGVTSYLDSVELQPDGSAPPLAVLRWWFALDYEAVQTDAAREVFHLPRGGVRVLSENELLAARGQRVHTNQSDELNRRFAESFTEHFVALREKYPLYGELQNTFDLALVLALVEHEHLLDRIGWQPSLLLDSEALRLPTLPVSSEVQTVINHRVIKRRHVIAGISGGVWVDAQRSLKIVPADSSRQVSPVPTTEGWWWD